MKKLSLIDNWKQCYKLASFQIAAIIVVLNTLQSATALMPPEVAQWLNIVLPGALMIARNFKQKVKDHE